MNIIAIIRENCFDEEDEWEDTASLVPDTVARVKVRVRSIKEPEFRFLPGEFDMDEEDEMNDKEIKDESLKRIFEMLKEEFDKYFGNSQLFIEAVNQVADGEVEITDEIIDITRKALGMNVRFWNIVQCGFEEKIKEIRNDNNE